MLYALLAAVFAILMCFAHDPVQFVITFWMLLFFGGCTVPTATGIVVSSVPKRQQNASSSLGQLIYNIFGYFLAPNISGLIMDAYDDKTQGLIVGIRFILLWNGFGVLFLCFALVSSIASI